MPSTTANVEIILSLFNKATLFHECAASVYAQSYDDWRCLIIDDGSWDGGALLAESIALDINRFLCLHGANGGVSRARNMGLDLVSAEYVMFLDGDDTYDPGICGTMLRQLTEDDSDVCYCGYHWMERGQWLRDVVAASEDYILDNPFRHLLARWLGVETKLFGSVCMGVYRLIIIRQNNIHFHEDIRLAEDMLFNIEYAVQAHRASLMKACMYRYMFFDGTLTASYNVNRSAEVDALTTGIRTAMTSYGCDGDEVSRITAYCRLSSIVGSLTIESRNPAADAFFSGFRKSVGMLGKDEARRLFTLCQDGVWNQLSMASKIKLVVASHAALRGVFYLYRRICRRMLVG
ncbi:hypothetical protein AGMMS49992_16250 [Clostridia bacterium]|nr:hypothetical protein AGMMS49992_16250 [Clostridia bacterium]